MKQKVKSHGSKPIVEETQKQKEEDETVIFNKGPSLNEDEFLDEIVNITDAETGENIDFEIEDQDKFNDY
jgi:hypothetical protein